jgi:hypothetical protein
MTADEIIAAWGKRRVAKKLKAFVKYLLRHQDGFEDILFIIALSEEKDIAERDMRALIDSEIREPLSYPYFPVRTDAHFMLARLLTTKMRAWDFRTGRKVA